MAHATRNAFKYGIDGVPDPPSVRADMKRVSAYVASAIQNVYRHETPEVLQARGVEVMMGRASFLASKELKIVESSKVFLLCCVRWKADSCKGSEQ